MACPTAGAQGCAGAGATQRHTELRLSSVPSSPLTCQELHRESSFQNLAVHPVPGGAQVLDGHALRPPVLLGLHHPLGRHQGERPERRPPGHPRCTGPAACLHSHACSAVGGGGAVFKSPRLGWRQGAVVAGSLL